MQTTHKGPAIYKLVNNITNDFYIGSAVNLYNRIHSHLSTLKKNKNGCLHLQAAWNKYDNQFSVEILEFIDDQQLLIEREQFYIDTLNPKYNINRVAGSRLGAKLSEESKNKMRIAKLENPTKYWAGKQLSVDHKNKLSISHKGKTTWNAGIPQNDISKQKNRLAHLGKKNGPPSDETKLKLSISNSKIVYQYSKDNILIKIWPSFTIAALSLNIHRTSISGCVSGRYKTAGGYIWKKTNNV